MSRFGQRFTFSNVQMQSDGFGDGTVPAVFVLLNLFKDRVAAESIGNEHCGGDDAVVEAFENPTVSCRANAKVISDHYETHNRAARHLLLEDGSVKFLTKHHGDCGRHTSAN